MGTKFKMIQELLSSYAGGALKKMIIEKAVEQITQRLFAFLPKFMAGGIIGSIITKYVIKGVVFIMEETVIGAHVLYVYGDTHFDKKAVRKTIATIREATLEGITDERRKELDDELAANLIELMQFGTMRRLQ